jgi:hypothetical protein
VQKIVKLLTRMLLTQLSGPLSLELEHDQSPVRNRHPSNSTQNCISRIDDNANYIFIMSMILQWAKLVQNLKVGNV